MIVLFESKVKKMFYPSFFQTCLIGILIGLGVSPMGAQELEGSDLSRYEIFEDGDTTPTLSLVATQEDEYKDLLKVGNCVEALPKIVEFAKNANFASNIIRRGNEPYYGARRDDQEIIAGNRALLNELISAERTLNKLIRQRNEAWVAEAKCLIGMGDKDAGVTRLLRVLDKISGKDESALWKEARDLLWQQVEFSPG